MDTTTTNLDHSDTNNTNTSNKRNRKQKTKKIPPTKKPKTTTMSSSSAIVSTQPLPLVQGFRLEAIFHPKFDNEHLTEHSIRQSMLSNKKGYLEVSIKHSGSLVLWSGGNRWYSKNAAANRFTATGQILLQQHFDDLQKYQACSDYLEQHRLTLAFEVVCKSSLGDHGDWPHRDFLLLTAVAHRDTKRFASTAELIQLALSWDLPQNDVWVFGSSSKEQLFEIYDSYRETGVASTIIPALNQAADAHVHSSYPHEQCQGDIMEGIVIRFVPCEDWNSALQQVQKLAAQLPRQPAGLEATNTNGDSPNLDKVKGGDDTTNSILTANLRKIYAETRDEPELQDSTLQQVLEQAKCRRVLTRASNERGLEIPILAEKLLTSSSTITTETKQIARLVRRLDALNDQVHFKVDQEEETQRWFCTIHVLFDKTFQKYRKQKQPDEMELFRGFVFELLVKEEESEESTNDQTEGPSQPQPVETEPLMLKMKLLPYMVRTFGCRNGLVRIQKGGPSEFSRFTRGLMTKWGISNVAKLKWQPFFDAWGYYAALPPERQFYSDRPLTNFHYLDHLIPFQKAFFNGEHPSTLNPNQQLKSLLLVVAPEADTAKTVANVVAEKLGVSPYNVLSGLKTISTKFMEFVCDSKQGHIVSAGLDEGVSKFKTVAKEYGPELRLILFQMTDEDLLHLTEKKTRGMIKAWKSIDCQSIQMLPKEALFDSAGKQVELSESFHNAVREVAEQEKNAASKPRIPGLLVFFPAIPGSGKSCIVKAEDEIRNRLKSMNGPDRQLSVVAGDKTKQKFFPFVRNQRRRDTSSVCIGDKNVPPTAWELTAGVCASTLGLGVPVLPDSAALCTTEIHGVKHLNGPTSETKHVYPFSLAYLAVCMARVLNRKANTHEGKLDQGTRRPCMIMLKFYSLYRRLTADGFLQSLEFKFEKEGATLAPLPVVLPFFKSTAPEIPADLQDLLTEALQIQAGFDFDRIDATKKAEKEIDNLEGKLQGLLKQHTEYLFSLAVEEEVTKQEFANQLLDRIAGCNEQDIVHQVTKAPAVIYKIAAIDVDYQDVQNILLDLHSSLGSDDLQPFLDLICNGRSLDEVLNSAEESSPLVTSTHVTLAHFNEVRQSDLRAMFEPLCGLQVQVQLTSLLWSKKTAAFEARLDPCTTLCGKELPRPKNEFVHVTIWFPSDSMAAASNSLPSLLNKGEATRLELPTPATIVGTVSLWEV